MPDPNGLQARVVGTVPVEGEAGAFAESLVVDVTGRLFLSVTNWMAPDSWNRSQVWSMTQDGTFAKHGPAIDSSLTTGLAVDHRGRLYIGRVTDDRDGVPSGVLRVDADGSVVPVLNLPMRGDTTAFPNGLAISGGDLFVSDSTAGAIWHGGLDGPLPATALEPWLWSPLLAPTNGWEGINGIAVFEGAVYAVNADAGTVIRIPIRPNGEAGEPSAFARDPALTTADGIAVDRLGRIWVAVNEANHGSLVRVNQDGSVEVLANHAAWLDYPTQPAFGRTQGDGTTVYVSNGSFKGGTPNVVAVEAGVTAAP